MKTLQEKKIEKLEELVKLYSNPKYERLIANIIDEWESIVKLKSELTALDKEIEQGEEAKLLRYECRTCGNKCLENSPPDNSVCGGCDKPDWGLSKNQEPYKVQPAKDIDKQKSDKDWTTVFNTIIYTKDAVYSDDLPVVPLKDAIDAMFEFSQQKCYPEEFVRWKDFNIVVGTRVDLSDIPKPYFVAESLKKEDVKYFTLPELYNYWKDNIKSKL